MTIKTDAIKGKPKDMRARCPVFDFGQEGIKSFCKDVRNENNNYLS